MNRFREINKIKMIRLRSYNPKRHSKVERSYQVFHRNSYYDHVHRRKQALIGYSMYFRVAFDNFAVRFTFIFRECLFVCLYYPLTF